MLCSKQIILGLGEGRRAILEEDTSSVSHKQIVYHQAYWHLRTALNMLSRVGLWDSADDMAKAIQQFISSHRLEHTDL